MRVFEASEQNPRCGALGIFHLSASMDREDEFTLARWWRGAVASRFLSEQDFHGHEEDGRTRARYPAVQYRWSEGSPVLFAFGEAADRALSYPWAGQELRLGSQARSITEVEWPARPLEVTASRRLVRYSFRTPWLPLNQENYSRFGSYSHAEQRAELDRILVGNLLSMSKGLGHFYDRDFTVYAAFEATKDVTCLVKDAQLLGFEGDFVTNLELPEDLALGRSVSHGFGWFRRA